MQIISLFRQAFNFGRLSLRFLKLSDNQLNFQLFIAVAVMCRKCAPLCKEYGLNGKKGEYEEWAEEYENKATEVRSAFRLAAGKLPMISASW